MSTFHYRRRLDRNELVMLAGAAAGAATGVATVLFYLGRIWLQKVSLKPHDRKTPAPVGPGPDPALRALAERVTVKVTERR